MDAVRTGGAAFSELQQAEGLQAAGSASVRTGLVNSRTFTLIRNSGNILVFDADCREPLTRDDAKWAVFASRAKKRRDHGKQPNVMQKRGFLHQKKGGVRRIATWPKGLFNPLFGLPKMAMQPKWAHALIL